MINWAGLVPEISPWSWTGLVSEIPATRRNIFQHEHSSPGDWDEPFLRKQLCFRNIAPKMAQFLSCMYFHFTSLWISLTCNSKVTRVYKTATVMNDPIFFTIAVFFLEFHSDQTGWNFPYELRPQICPGFWMGLWLWSFKYNYDNPKCLAKLNTKEKIMLDFVVLSKIEFKVLNISKKKHF